MPAVHTRAFRVRYYECDANGYLTDANYLRYMEEAAFDASAAVGYDKARYEAMGYLWLARETEIEHLSPVVYGDTVEITTQVQDFRRVRSWRVYEFRRAGSDEVIALGGTDWVYLNRETMRPNVIPPEMIAAFAPDGDVAYASRRERFPEPPPPPSGVYIAHRCPEWRDIDSAQHVNNAVYLDYVADLGRQAALHYGWPQSRMQEAGFAMIARQHHVEYLIPALLDDELELATWMSDVNSTSCLRHYTIRRARDGALLTRIRSRWMFVDLHTGQPIRIDADFAADFAPHIVNQ